MNNYSLSHHIFYKVSLVKEDHLLRKRIKQFYAIKAICLHTNNGCLDDRIEFANIQAQLEDKEMK